MELDRSKVGEVQIRTGDFEYINIPVGGDAEAAVQAFKGLKTAFTASEANQAGLPQKEWNRVLVGYLKGSGCKPEEFERMSKAQTWMLHELDKAFTRMKREEGGFAAPISNEE